MKYINSNICNEEGRNNFRTQQCRIYKDIYVYTEVHGNSDDNNTCDTTYYWNDNGKTGRTFACLIQVTDDLYINEDTTLYKKNYDVDDNGNNGVITINSSNIVLDCNNATLNGNTTGYGIYNLGFDNVTIKNCKIKNYTHGIHIENSDPNKILENEISNNNIGIYSKNSNLTINSNIVCGNTNLDFDSSDWLSSSGTNNTCDNPDQWNDNGINGCWYTCSGLPRVCDLNHDGIIIHDYNDLMTVYKCFLGIESCDNYYQSWNLIKQEYQCFTKNDI